LHEISKAVKIHTVVFEVTILYTAVSEYQLFKETYSGDRYSVFPKHWYPSTGLHGVMSQKIATYVIICP
jgi:hypothetical protein